MHTIYIMTSSNKNIFRATVPFVRGKHRSPVEAPHKVTVTRTIGVFCRQSEQTLDWLVIRDAVTSILRRHNVMWVAAITLMWLRKNNPNGLLTLRWGTADIRRPVLIVADVLVRNRLQAFWSHHNDMAHMTKLAYRITAITQPLSKRGRQQFITEADIGSDLCCHMTSLGLNALTATDPTMRMNLQTIPVGGTCITIIYFLDMLWVTAFNERGLFDIVIMSA